MEKQKKNIAGTVRDLVSPVADSFGFMLWDVEYVKEGSRQILRITIDSENGIDINDCERVHRAIDPILDEADPIPVQYYLEVSSPGLERELRTAEHIAKCIGQKVTVKFYVAVNGSKELTAVLTGYSPEKDTVTLDETEFERNKIAKMHLYCEF